MNARQFFEAVAKMRDLQKSYFKTRSSLSLQAAKGQERIIDDEIKRVKELLESKEERRDLFNQPVTGESRR